MTSNKSSDTQESSNRSIARREYLKLVGASGAGLGVGGTSLVTLGTNSVKASTSVLDDFEDDNISEYSGTKSEFEVVSSGEVLEGNYTLKTTGDYPRIGHDSQTTTRDSEYKCRVMAGNGSGSKPGLLTCVQNSSYPLSNCYWVQLNIQNNSLQLYLRDSSSSTLLDSTGVSLSEETEYQISTELAADTIKGVVYDSSGNILASTDVVTETTYTDGTFGFYVGGSPGYPAYIDYVTQEPLDSFKQSVIEDFERANNSLDLYDFDRGQSSARIVSDSEYSGPNQIGPSYSGRSALEISNSDTEMISRPGDGLSDYPTTGDKIACYVMATDGAGKLNLTYGVQNHMNRYYVHLNYTDDELLLMKYKNGTPYVLDSQKSGFSLTEDSWYWIEVHWETGGTHTVELYDLEDYVVAECTGTDAEWKDGGIGFDAYLESTGGTVYFDKCIIIENEDNLTGGWGPEDTWEYTTTPTGDPNWDLVNDFNYYLNYAGSLENSEDGNVVGYTHRFMVSGSFNTYSRENTFDTNPTNSKVEPAGGQDGNKVTIDVNTNNSDVVFSVPDNATWATALTPSEWTDWKNSNWDQEVSFNEFKQRAIDEGVLAEDSPDYVTEALFFMLDVGIAYAFGPPVGIAVATLEQLARVAYNPPNNCDLTQDPNVAFYEEIGWDFCDPMALTAHERYFELRVPADVDSVDVVVEQEVQSIPGDSFEADNICRWEITCPGSNENATWSVSTRQGDI